MSSIDKIKKFAKSMKLKIEVLFIASQRSDISMLTKFILVVVVGYALSPIDLIPDFIPVLGYLDDLVLLPIGIALVIRLLPGEIYSECEAQAIMNKEREIPKNQKAALIIVIIWLCLILLLLQIIVRYFS